MDRGATGIVIAQRNAADLPLEEIRRREVICFGVADTRRALGDLANFHRRRSGAKVVAITGSNGKTSTREMTAVLLARRWRTLTPQGNFNNDIGVPLTLLNLSPDHQWAVLELGTNHPGEIDRLTQICEPDVGAITNIGPAHLEYLGTLDGVMAAKGELLSRMAADKPAVLNADDHRVRQLGENRGGPVLYFGHDRSADIRGSSIRSSGARVHFDLTIRGRRQSVTLHTPARFMVLNALAAAGIAHLAGMPETEIQAGLEAFRAVHGRMVLRETPMGVTIIDDTYNANPASMAASVETLASLGRSGRRAFVAGDMLELGPAAADLHREVGMCCGRWSVDRLYLTGTFAEATARGARDGGMPADAIVVDDKDGVTKDLKAWLRPGDWVAVKGSRAMGMETVVAELLRWAEAQSMDV
jgi:UDP-N-acetylmuramoyl-tripeptide--D-alanyl-D-alanine ligase